MRLILYALFIISLLANKSFAQEVDSAGTKILTRWSDSFQLVMYGCDPYSNLDNGWLNEHPDSLCALNVRSYDSLNVFQISDEIGRFKNIQELTIYSYKTAIILPPEVGQLQRLKLLMIYSCLQGDSLPASLQTCDSLTYLFIFCLKTAKTLPGDLNHLKGLRFLTLNLKGNHSSSMYRSLLTLEKSKSLQVVNIQGWPYSNYRKKRFIRKMKKKDCYVYVY